jgi:hypothetical protein
MNTSIDNFLAPKQDLAMIIHAWLRLYGCLVRDSFLRPHLVKRKDDEHMMMHII